MIPLSTRESLMAALEHDRVIEPAKKIKNAIQNLKDFGEGLFYSCKYKFITNKLTCIPVCSTNYKNQTQNNFVSEFQK